VTPLLGVWAICHSLSNNFYKVQYESSRTSEVGGNDFWELGGTNDVKICLVVDKGDVQPTNEKKIIE
jgi:hypothetical protein